MTEECKECKVICAECKYCSQATIGTAGSTICGFYTKNEMNCVTGKMEPAYANCNDYNKDGKCKGFAFDEVKASRRKLHLAVTEERMRHGYCSHPDYYGDVLLVLERYLEGDYSALKPFCFNPSKRDKCY